MTRHFRIAALACALMTTGCASITQGTTQTLIFKMEPLQTVCTLSREGEGELGVVNSTQNTITVGKDKDDIIVVCKAPGYEDKSMRLVSSASTAGVAGGAFIDLGITDMITGAMWQYQSEIRVALNKPGQAPVNSDFAKPL
ncbi:MAG TPA: hypothetical protein VFV43_13040 [Limnobacter sp.]|nr:hypothetical protein [Limnobacter sp.]